MSVFFFFFFFVLLLENYLKYLIDITEKVIDQKLVTVEKPRFIMYFSMKLTRVYLIYCIIYDTYYLYSVHLTAQHANNKAIQPMLSLLYSLQYNAKIIVNVFVYYNVVQW